MFESAIFYQQCEGQKLIIFTHTALLLYSQYAHSRNDTLVVADSFCGSGFTSLDFSASEFLCSNSNMQGIITRNLPLT